MSALRKFDEQREPRGVCGSVLDDHDVKAAVGDGADSTQTGRGRAGSDREGQQRPRSPPS